MMPETENAKLIEESPEPDFAAWVGIDWGDREHVWCLQVKGSTQYEKGKLKNQPEAIELWISQLCQRFPQQAIAVAMEKCRGALILLLSRLRWMSCWRWWRGGYRPLIVVKERKSHYEPCIYPVVH